MKFCMGCMEEIDDHVVTCPYCGFNEGKQTEECYLRPGTILAGKYIVGKGLDYSGKVAAYIGMDAEHGRKVMINEYLPGDCSMRSGGESRITIYSGDALEQFSKGLISFLNESSALEKLQGLSGIIQVYECISENDTGYVVTEYLEGQILQEQLDEGVHFSADKVVEMFCELLQSIAVLHENGIVHRDIAPDTLFVTRENRLKLFGFGMSGYEMSASSKSLAAVIKRGYAPEEQYRVEKLKEPVSDVYALAAVMYRMITGKVPAEAADRALKDELKTPGELGIEVSASVQNALMNALHVHKQDRTASAGAFLQELENPDTKRRIQKKESSAGAKKRWIPAAAAGILVLGLAIGGIAAATHRNSGGKPVDQGTISEKTVKVPDLTKFSSYEEAVSEVEKEGFLLKPEIIFDMETDGEKIVDQTVSPGTEVHSIGGEAVKSDGKIEIGCTVLTSERAQYRVVRTWVASQYLFNEELKEQIYMGEAQKNPRSKPYGELAKIELKDGTELTPGQLMSETNDEKFLVFEDIKNIFQYTGDIYRIEAMKDYVGTYVKDVSFKVDSYSKEGKKEVRTNTAKDKLPVNEEYYSLSKEYGAGYIVSQAVKPGERYSSDEIGGALFTVVGKTVIYSKEDADTLLKSLRELKGVIVKTKGKGEMVAGVTVKQKKKLSIAAKDVLFKAGDTVLVTLEAKKAQEPTIQATPNRNDSSQRQQTKVTKKPTANSKKNSSKKKKAKATKRPKATKKPTPKPTVKPTAKPTEKPEEKTAEDTPNPEKPSGEETEK